MIPLYMIFGIYESLLFESIKTLWKCFLQIKVFRPDFSRWKRVKRNKRDVFVLVFFFFSSFWSTVKHELENSRQIQVWVNWLDLLRWTLRKLVSTAPKISSKLRYFIFTINNSFFLMITFINKKLCLIDRSSSWENQANSKMKSDKSKKNVDARKKRELLDVNNFDKELLFLARIEWKTKKNSLFSGENKEFYALGAMSLDLYRKWFEEKKNLVILACC